MSNWAASLIRHRALLKIFFSGQFNSVDLQAPPETWSKVLNTEDRQHENSLYDRVKVWEVRQANRYWSRITPHDEKRKEEESI
ncbi:hypothetical protein E4U09_003195 [Claviceps aff. purpurea]|uniref:Uncharacterized protein n=1 Tax=Claviceps aff. purpurea TaxID=1967640 RepID=A0A9P7QPP2_9HYPO|nr:hypothetical protein E4U09_003195 [Claviceps aff. purpurea]